MKTISPASLITLFLLGISFSGLQAQTLVDNEKGGTQIYLTLNNICKLNLAEGTLTINKTDGSSGIYPIRNIQYISFADYMSNISKQNLLISKSKILYTYPASDLSKIWEKSIIPGSMQIKIVDIQGSLEKQLEQNSQGGTSDVIIDVTGLPCGFYIFRMQISNKAENSRPVKK